MVFTALPLNFYVSISNPSFNSFLMLNEWRKQATLRRCQTLIAKLLAPTHHFLSSIIYTNYVISILCFLFSRKVYHGTFHNWKFPFLYFYNIDSGRHLRAFCGRKLERKRNASRNNQSRESTQRIGSGMGGKNKHKDVVYT